MEKLFEKIDSYNIFNYFVPGAIISEFLRVYIGINSSSDILTRLVLYYFVGLTVSRIGSMIFDPIFELIRLIRKSNYTEYVKACAKDAKIELFVEIANMYRTIYVGSIAGFVTTILVSPSKTYSFDKLTTQLMLSAAAFLFFFSYRKQSEYINKRVKIHSK